MGFSGLTLEQERRELSLQADGNRTTISWFYAKIHCLHSIQSAIDGLRTCLCSCILAKTYLFLMGFYGGPWVFM